MDLKSKAISVIQAVSDTASWNADLSTVFSEGPLPKYSSGVDVSQSFQNIQKLYQEQIKSWWEIHSLEKYVEHKLVPRGLRPEISLPNRVIKEEHVQEWNSLLLECSFKLMGFLGRLEKEYLETTNKELSEEIVTLEKFKTDPQFGLMENRLQKNLDNYKKMIKEKKHFKFQRDSNDFKTNNIFKRKNRSRRRFPPGNSNKERVSTS